MNNGKKGGILWIGLVAVLVCALVVIVGIAIHKNTTDTPTDSQTSQTSQNSGNEGQDTSEIETTETGSESESESGTQIDPPDPAEGKELFVIFGVDSRSNQLGKGTRSDSIMLVSMDHTAKEVTVVSIYRDCMLYQEGKGYKKITNAHSYGGPEFSVSVLNENLDLNLEHFVTVNFGAVTEMVDKIGGVDIELSQKEVDLINTSCTPKLEGPGVHHLNGEQALYFSRIREIGSDYARTERQREVLFEIFETSKAMKESERIDLAVDMLDEINTNYKEDDIINLLYYLSEYKIVTMTAYPQIFYGGSVDGHWVEVPCTLVDMSTELHKLLLGETEYTPSERVQEISKALRDKVSGPNINLKK
ncbi:MAG: LCP family protein [Agathobacter sp.]